MSQRAPRSLTAHWPLLVALALGLALRLALWGQLPRTGLISDEAEYLASADWLANGRGFAWHTQYLWTRAPLYPLLLGGHVALFGRALEPIFVTQTLLSLGNVALTYALTRRLTAGRTALRAAPGLAAGLVALYLPLASYAQLLLSETLFVTLLLGATVLLGTWAEQRQRAESAGVAASQRDGESRPHPQPRAQSRSGAPSRLAMSSSRLPLLPLWEKKEAEGMRAGSPGRHHSLMLRGHDTGTAFARALAAPGLPALLGAGVLLGLATLTRGLTLGFLPLAAGWAWWIASRQPGPPRDTQGHRDDQQMPDGVFRHLKQILRREALGPPLALALAAGTVVAPWSLYATRAYGGLIVVDTTGAFNLALGARTAYDGGRSDEPTRSFVLALLLPDLSPEQRAQLLAERRGPSGDVVRGAACLYERQDPRLLEALARAPALTQGDRQRLLSAEATCLLTARPLAFVAKSLTELVDLFKINYTGAERLTDGFALGRVPPWYAAALFLLDDTLYVLALPLAVLGWALLRAQGGSTEAPGAALLALVGLWLLYNLAAAPLLFAINRFRVPLMPFAFALVGAALAALPALPGLVRQRYGAACATLAGLLLLVAASPYAYLEPRAPGQDSRWASYLGPYPSSLANTAIAMARRERHLREQELGAALGAGDVAAARAALEAPGLPVYAAAVGGPLVAGLEGRPAAGLDLLAAQPRDARPLEPWQTALVAGELFRQLGDLDAARRELGPTLVDNENPVAWAWAWLYPPRLPGDRIELADDNDLGYIKGFYLGRYDPEMPRPGGTAGATVRWATGEAALRFPGAGTGAPRRLCLLASGRGWPDDLELPTVTAELGGEPVGAFGLTRQLEETCLELPARPVGADLVVSLRAATFVPDALDLIAQQGPQVGQLRLLAYQLDSAEVR